MKTITYTNKQRLEIKINKFASGAFSLTFNNGVHTFCYTMTELRTILLKNGMTRKWAANVKDRFDPLTEEHVLINRYRTSSGGKTFRNVNHLHEPSANQIGRSNYGGRVSVNPQSGNGVEKAENRTRRIIH